MVEEGDLDDKLEDKATNEVVDDVKKVAMGGGWQGEEAGGHEGCQH